MREKCAADIADFAPSDDASDLHERLRGLVVAQLMGHSKVDTEFDVYMVREDKYDP